MIASSKKFEVTITGTHGVIVPMIHAKPFLNTKQSRVALTAYFEGNTLSFHGKLHQHNDEVLISFGKHYQKTLGVAPLDYFQLQIHEDTSKYGVDVPEAFSVVLETDAQAFELFEKLSMGKRRSLIYYISRFKNTQTQIDKSLMICDNLKIGIVDTKQLVIQQ